jgi:putative PEP-CTERM system histidine kinase
VRTLSERSAQDNLNESAIRSVAQIIESDAGALWLLDEHARFYRPAATWTSASAEIGTESPYVPQFDEPLLQFMSRTGWVVDGAELRRQPELYDNASLPSELTRLGADCLVVPLLHVESMYGFLLLRRPLDLPQLNFEDRDLLKTVGRHLAAHLWQADNDRRLAHGREFEAYHRLTAFVMHDLKNLTAQLRLVVQNAEKHKRNPEFVDDAIATIANSVERMGKLLAELQREPSAGATRTVSLADVTQRAALRAGARLPVPAVKIATDASVAADPDRLSMVMDHVLRNAQDATQEDGEISVIVDVREGAPLVAVADTGCGMTEAFVRERLFRPFDTTKGSRGMGIGAYQVREYLRSLGGEVLVKSSAGSGTTLTLVFPRQPVSASAHA